MNNKMNPYEDLEKHYVLLKKIILFAFLIVCQPMGSYAKPNPTYYFKQISTEQGLSQTMVRSILCDNNGLLWFGTKAGLNCFDQHEFKNYFNEKENLHSLPDNLIHFVAEDSLGSIWVGTEKGLVLYNRADDNFTRINYKTTPLRVFSFLCVPGGVLFGGTGNLYFYSYQTKLFKELESNTNKKRITPEFNKIYLWDKNTLLIGSRYEGLYFYHTKNALLEKVPFISDTSISSVYIDTHQRLWLSPYNQGLKCYNHEGVIESVYNVQNSQITNNVVLDIVERDSLLWIATDGGGINILNRHNRKITTIEHNPGDSYSLPANSIYCLYNDKENNLWAGCVRGGALGIRETYIRSYRDAALQNNFGLSEKAVISLYEDEEGILWTGTDGGGLNSYDPNSQTFTHYLSTYLEKIVSISGYKQDQLLLSFFQKGLYLFNKKSRTLTPFTLINEVVNASECHVGISVLCTQIAQNKILFLANQVYVYDLDTKQFSLSPTMLDEQRILQPIDTKDGITYLLGLKGVYRFLHKNNHLERIITIDQSEVPITACLDRWGIWLGGSQGLEHYDLKTMQHTKIETNLFRSISALTYDHKGRLWIGAQNMLFCYNLKEKKFTILGESDGMYPNELLHMPTLKNRQRYLYMGGSSGLICIDENIKFDNSSLPQIKLMDVLVDGSSKIESMTERKDAIIEVPWNYNSLTIKLVTKEKDVFRKKMFRYDIVGSEKKSIESYSHILNIPSLSPGSYAIIASCSSQSGDWSTPIKILSIRVIPPWWKSTWFIISSSMSSILLILLLIYLFIQTNRRKVKWQMKEYEKKTYEEKIRFLINISHELRTPLTLIYAPLKRLQKSDLSAIPGLSAQLAGIYKQSNQMRNTLNMVLDARKMEVGQETLSIQTHPLNEWLKSIAEDFREEFQSKNIRLSYRMDETIAEVPFDKAKCEIVVSNLLMNALKFSESNTIVEISTQPNALSQTIRVAISDQGIGLAGVDQEKLFTRFYQGDHQQNGSGIGLSYAKIIMAMHRGTIGAFNNADKGATFYFELPMQNSSCEVACKKKPYLNELLHSSMDEANIMVTPSHFSTSSYSVLVVEDHAELRGFLKDALLQTYHHVYVAKNGKEALSIISQHHPDIVVSDIMMPQMNGLELCKEIKECLETSHIPVVLLTARSDMDSISQGYKLGADLYVPKPFDIDFLTTVMANLLYNREHIKARYKQSVLQRLPQEATFSHLDEQFLVKLNKQIDENLANPDLNVVFLIDRMAMSRTALYNKLKSITSMGVNDYINQYRIEKAAELLIGTELTITEISEQTGFAYQRYFSELFKSMKGVSPSQYRKEAVAQPNNEEERKSEA